MAVGHYGAAMQHLQRLFARGTVAGMTEAQLLRQYADRRDEAAFAAIVARHGPMVLGVCRALLPDTHDAEDAFQATFLVLVKKAGSLGDRDVLAAWLYGVARRAALKARSRAARRHAREGQEVVMAEAPAADLDRIDLRPVVHEELDRLPAKYRDPVVLCYLEGLTHEQAAAQLRWPVGTVKGRLSRARDLLRDRLSRRGLAVPAGAVLAALSRESRAAVPLPLAEETIKAAMLVAAGRAVAAGAVSASVAALMEGALQSMSLFKLKVAAAGLVAAGVAATGAGVLAFQAPEEGPRVEAAGKAPQPVVPEVRGESPGQVAKNEAPGLADPASSGPRSIANLADARLKAAQKALETAKMDYQAGRIVCGRVRDMALRVLDARRDRSDKKEDQIAAFKDYLALMKQIAATERLPSTYGPGRRTDLTESEYYRLEAELWLARAQAGPPVDRPGQGPGPFPGKDPRSQAVLQKLDQPIPINYPAETPLEDVLKYIKAATSGQNMPEGIPIYVDPVGLQEADKTMQSPIQLDLEGIPLRMSLHLLLKQLGLVYGVREGMLVITHESEINSALTEPDIAEPTPIMILRSKAERGELSLEETERVKKLDQAIRALKGQPAGKEPQPKIGLGGMGGGGGGVSR